MVADQPVVIAAQQQMQAPLPAATVTEFDHADDVFEDAQEENNVRRSGRTRQQVEKYPGMQEFPKNLKLGIQAPVRKHSANVASSYTEVEPKTVKQALASENSDKWKEAMDSEYQSLLKNKTWSLEKLPEGRSTVGSKWCFKIKRDADGKIDRFKARLVAQGYSQEYGIDYAETFSPVARYTSVRMVLSLANQLDWEADQMDVQTAFLNGTLDEEIFMKQPVGYVEPGKEDFVCKLKKSLYGLKQASRCWNTAMDTFLRESGYRKSTADSCVYCKVVGDDLIIIALYVDDLLIVTKHRSVLDKEKKVLSSKFDTKDLGPVHHILGIKVDRDRENRRLFMSQEKLFSELLQNFGMENCNPVSTPIEAGLKLESHDGDSVDKARYQSLIGSINYAVTATRPDLAAALTSVNKFMQNPGPQHWSAAKRILRYIKGTLSHGILFSGDDSGITLSGYTDADWGGDIETRQSTSGYVFNLGGGPISWRSKRQQEVAQSTVEAEYIAASVATRECLWLRHLLSDIGFEQLTTTVFCDNQGAIAISKNPTHHERTKHMGLKVAFVRDHCTKGDIQLVYCPTNEMLADVFTKFVPRDRFSTLINKMSVVGH
ncbi:MAG: hypothetical protein GY696_33120 [Gammaproteobacteria bacterium]|nr:hypothetical protein [Gammaproteobacteria bacterium]